MRTRKHLRKLFVSSEIRRHGDKWASTEFGHEYHRREKQYENNLDTIRRLKRRLWQTAIGAGILIAIFIGAIIEKSTWGTILSGIVLCMDVGLFWFSLWGKKKFQDENFFLHTIVEGGKETRRTQIEQEIYEDQTGRWSQIVVIMASRVNTLIDQIESHSTIEALGVRLSSTEDKTTLLEETHERLNKDLQDLEAIFKMRHLVKSSPANDQTIQETAKARGDELIELAEELDIELTLRELIVKKLKEAASEPA